MSAPPTFIKCMQKNRVNEEGSVSSKSGRTGSCMQVFVKTLLMCHTMVRCGAHNCLITVSDGPCTQRGRYGTGMLLCVYVLLSMCFLDCVVSYFCSL